MSSQQRRFAVEDSSVGVIDTLIRKLEQYGPVPDEERQFLSNTVARIVAYDIGDTIVSEGSAPTESCIMVDGFAGRVRILPDGGRQIMAFHIPGDFCDLHSFLLRQMDHGIQALSRCRIAKVPHAKILEITERFPRLTRALWWDVAVDGAIHREWMTSMGRRSAYEQIAHLLCEMLLRLRSVGLSDGRTYDLPVTQADLGDAFGLSAVHVNRTLQALRRGKLIESDGKRITVPDIDALKEAAGFDPAYLETRGAVQASTRA